MANTLTAVIPQLLAQGLMALRENAITARLVNRSYDTLAAQRGTTIDVPIPSAITAVQVAAAEVPPSTADITPTSVPVELSEWYEAPFYLTDKEMLEVMSGYIPVQASEAVRALINNMDDYLLAKAHGPTGFFGWAFPATSGSPLAVIADATNLRKVLNEQLSPMDNRHVVLDPAAEANALGLNQFADSTFSGSVQAILEGQLNRKLGAQWWMNQNIPTHTVGTLSDGSNAAAVINGTEINSVGASGPFNIDEVSLSGTIEPGDILEFAADTTGHYVVTNTTTLTAAGNALTGITIAPATRVAIGDGTAVTLLGNAEAAAKATDYVANIGFHRDAFAFATRPLDQATQGLGAISMSDVDPISGLALRIEVTREHKRTRFAYDVLYGAEVVRRELGVRLPG